MDLIWLRVILFIAVVAGLSAYLYGDGARRAWDIALSGVAIVATSPIFAAIAAYCAIKYRRVFDRSDGLRFTASVGVLKNLPCLLSVFAGKRNILPLAPFKKTQ